MSSDKDLIKYVDLNDFKTEIDRREKNEKDLNQMLADLRTEQDKFKNDQITFDELKTRVDKMTGELTRITEELTIADNAKRATANNLIYNDYRSLIKDNIWVFDPSGQPLPEIDQKAHALFQVPVTFNDDGQNQELINLRNLHDATYIYDSYMRYNDKRYHIRQSKLFASLKAATEKFDKKLADAMITTDAMASGNVGYGYEWVPVEMSAQFNEYFRKFPALPNKFEYWMMPPSSSGKFPFANGKASVYKGGEATTYNPPQARKTKVATSAKTFTPDVFIGALPVSEELTEDSILNMVEFIRKELAVALLEGLETCIINGDDSESHLDTGGSDAIPTAWSTEKYEIQTCFKGIRKLATAASKTVNIETASSGTGVGVLDMDGILSIQAPMGVMGLNPADCLWVTGIIGRNQIASALESAAVYGTISYLTSGILPPIYGSELYTSEHFREDLTDAGIFDNSTETHTALAFIHKPSFRVAQRRGITIEYNKDILTQQQQFVASARWDWGQVASSSLYPVILGINMQHT